jgi:uncharacterized protein
LSVYFDASVLVPLQVQEANTQIVQSFAVEADGSIFVSSLAAGEFASALSRLVRMNLLTVDEANNRLRLFDMWLSSTTSILIDNADITRAAALVRRFELKLLMPDAIHITLCVRHQLVMVTLDKILAEAAGVLGVEVVVPGV